MLIGIDNKQKSKINSELFTKEAKWLKQNEPDQPISVECIKNKKSVLS
jgi:hypothetical protein